MMKKLCLILISIFTIFSLTSCMRPKEKVIGDFVCIQEYNSYSIIGLSEEGKTKKELVIPSKINDREVYMKGIDASYNYEGYSVYSIQDLNSDN